MKTHPPPPTSSMAKETTLPESPSLKELRDSLSEIDALRLMPDITPHEQKVLEITAVALRDAERLAIAKLQKQLFKDLEEQTASLNALARTIRARVTRMNKLPKVLDNIESVIKTAVKIVAAIAKW